MRVPNDSALWCFAVSDEASAGLAHPKESFLDVVDLAQRAHSRAALGEQMRMGLEELGVLTRFAQSHQNGSLVFIEPLHHVCG